MQYETLFITVSRVFYQQENIVNRVMKENETKCDKDFLKLMQNNDILTFGRFPGTL